jgi:DNA polymerase
LRIHLDFETFCELDLRKVGRARYFDHPSFTVDMVAWAIDDGPVQQAVDQIPEALTRDLRRADTVHAFGAGFEIGVLKKYGVNLPLSKWRCTMAHAYARSYAGGLRKVGDQTGIPEELRKMKEGQYYVGKFSKPRKPSKHNPDTRWTPENASEDWAEYLRYNRLDVEAERAVYRKLEGVDPWSVGEQRIWEFDYEVNQRGVPVDLTLADNALSVVPQYVQEAEETCTQITGGIKPSQVDALLQWCRERGYPYPNLQAPIIRQALDEGALPPGVRTVLQARLDSAQAATKKYQTLRNTQLNGRVHDTMVAWGAQRTGRWSGRALQIQNLKRPAFDTQEEIDHAVRLLISNPVLFYRIYSLEDLGSLIRSSIRAPEGSLIVDADLANIEPRIAGWLTGCRALNAIFAAGRDPYRSFGESWLGIPYDQIDKATRNECKPPFLGCGYRLWEEGLISYAENRGVDLTPEKSKSAVQTFRRVYWEIPRMWKKLEAWWRLALINGESGPFHYDRENHVLKMWLPSGRYLYYMEPESNGTGFGSLSFKGWNQYKDRWERIETHGGKTFENAVQALSRDAFVEGMLRFRDHGGRIFAHTHDQALAEAPEEEAEAQLRQLKADLSVSPWWAPDIILGAEGYFAQRSRKA